MSRPARLLPVLALVLAGLAPRPAAADGEQARLAVIGFAKDGSAFAFEQFGWQSNHTFPFSELSVIETATGKFFAGAPSTSPAPSPAGPAATPTIPRPRAWPSRYRRWGPSRSRSRRPSSSR